MRGATSVTGKSEAVELVIMQIITHFKGYLTCSTSRSPFTTMDLPECSHLRGRVSKHLVPPSKGRGFKGVKNKNYLMISSRLVARHFLELMETPHRLTYRGFTIRNKLIPISARNTCRKSEPSQSSQTEEESLHRGRTCYTEESDGNNDRICSS